MIPTMHDLIAGLPNTKITSNLVHSLQSMMLTVSHPSLTKSYLFEDGTNFQYMKDCIDADFKPLEQTT